MPGVSKLLWALLLALLAARVIRCKPSHGVRPSNVLGGLEQHASFSFVRPGLTQTAYAFNGPSSHQAFSSSVGDPHLAQRVLPSVAHALAYRNPGLGYASVGSQYVPGPPQAPLAYQQQQQLDYQQQQALALAYQQQLQQYQQYQQQQAYSEYAQQLQAQPATQQSVEQAHLGRLLAARLSAPQAHSVAEAVPEQIQLQQQQQQQQQQEQQQQQQQTANLLGVAYSAAPSVAHVKVNGNGYKFDF